MSLEIKSRCLLATGWLVPFYKYISLINLIRDTTSWWNQGEPGCFITRWSIPRAIACTCVVWVYAIRNNFWPFLTVVLLLYSWTCLPIESSVTPFSFTYSDVIHWYRMRPSALVHSCHMASPFPLESVSHATMSSTLVLCLPSAFVTYWNYSCISKGGFCFRKWFVGRRILSLHILHLLRRCPQTESPVKSC